MIASLFVFALLFAAAQSPASPPVDPAIQGQAAEQARAKYDVMRQAAIHINDLAGNIHSEADARAFVDAVAERLSDSEGRPGRRSSSVTG
ncbi:MAG: hypothetical protein WB919_10620 [Candidatus Sulfotelmatobacter sp.]